MKKWLSILTIAFGLVLVFNGSQINAEKEQKQYEYNLEEEEHSYAPMGGGKVPIIPAD